MSGAEKVNDNAGSQSGATYELGAESIYEERGLNGHTHYEQVASPVIVAAGEKAGRILVASDHSFRGRLVAANVLNWPTAREMLRMVTSDGNDLKTYLLDGAITVTEVREDDSAQPA